MCVQRHHAIAKDAAFSLQYQDNICVCSPSFLNLSDFSRLEVWLPSGTALSCFDECQLSMDFEYPDALDTSWWFLFPPAHGFSFLRSLLPASIYSALFNCQCSIECEAPERFTHFHEDFSKAFSKPLTSSTTLYIWSNLWSVHPTAKWVDPLGDPKHLRLNTAPHTPQPSVSPWSFDDGLY